MITICKLVSSCVGWLRVWSGHPTSPVNVLDRDWEELDGRCLHAFKEFPGWGDFCVYEADGQLCGWARADHNGEVPR